MKTHLFHLISFLLLAALYAPVLCLVVFGFNASTYALRWEGFSIQWYESTLRNPDMLSALFNSLAVATLSTFLAVLFAFLYALWSHKQIKKTWAGVGDGMMTLPLFMPEIVIAIGLLIVMVNVFRPAAGWFGLNLDSLASIVLGHTTLAMGYATLVLRNRFKTYDAQQDLAALDLGATPAQVLFRIMLPQMLPGLAAAACLSFAVSLDDFYVSYFLSTGGSSLQTLPTYIWSLQGRRAMTPEINVVSSLLLFIAVFFFTAGMVLTRIDTAARQNAKDKE
ncbi:MAG: hypothetical protein RIR26_2629 [Pseudomonadota bacterium]